MQLLEAEWELIIDNYTFFIKSCFHLKNSNKRNLSRNLLDYFGGKKEKFETA